MSNILITGATGHLGSIVIEHALNKIPASQISVLVRDKEKAQLFKEKGLQIKIGNYHDIDSLDKAMKGIDKLLLISSSDFNNRIGQHKNVIDAAKKNNVKHILYTGVTIKDITNSPIKPLLEDHFQTEEYIKSNGFLYTFLQNNLYSDVIPMFIGENVFETGIYFPADEGKVAFANRKDLGEAIAKIATGEEYENKVYNLTSKNTHSFKEIATILSSLSNTNVSYTSPDPKEYEKMLTQIGLPEGIILMSTLFAAAIKNDDFNITGSTLEEILGHDEIDFKSFLKETYHF
ncbi:SDR family oxidoreductase [Flavobacterium jejuense]|uniref:SDR family oxidoreductase n=1 Tax=Flavobacterium jejuense TaxID=1544455 RepID=A0ABX0INV7_9FLAO|nr:SDR family oxidoreductase [Flavobacterium jejuense]NHN24484.1 SDR family oxidoreductase [Flavobacterium jejuense]